MVSAFDGASFESVFDEVESDEVESDEVSVGAAVESVSWFFPVLIADYLFYLSLLRVLFVMAGERPLNLGSLHCE